MDAPALAKDGSFGLAAIERSSSSRAGAGGDDAAPVNVEAASGELARLVFRLAPGHTHDEEWPDRPVRAPPAAAYPTGRLAYFNNSKTASNSNVLQVILRDHGYERAESVDEEWSVFWCAGQVDATVLSTFTPHQKVNKFPKATALTLKANLWTCVKQMQTKHGVEHFGFMPPTLVFPREIKLFEKHLKEWMADEGASAEDGMWIFKPAAAYCGKGIWLHRPDREAMRELDSKGAGLLTDDMHQHKGVVSRYIHPPFLLDGLKSDIRLYVLVTSFHPLTVYLYGEGLARFATETYDTSNPDERCGHLTNYSLNKFNEKFVKNTNEEQDDRGSKWSLTAFKRRLVAEWGEDKAAEVWRAIDDLVVKTVIAAEPSITSALEDTVPAATRGEPVRQCFQVFGFDVMLDASGKPYLLEVNLDPALRTESPLDLRIKSGMLTDLLNVVGMPLPPRAATAADPKADADVAIAAAALATVVIAAAPIAAAPIAAATLAAAAVANTPTDVSDLDSNSPSDSLFSMWRTANPAPPASPQPLSDVHRWALHLVNSEFERSKGGKWRRLFPSARSEEYWPFLEQRNTMHRLPFDI